MFDSIRCASVTFSRRRRIGPARNRARALAAILVGFIALTPAGSARAQDEETSGLTYHKDILPIFARTCLGCHHTGGSAPQSLETYKLARSWIRTSGRQMREGLMPPWHAESGADRWRNAILPTAEDAETVRLWIEDKAPEGDPADTPPPLDFSSPWALGEPDRVLEIAEPFTVPSVETDHYRAFILTTLDTETWLSAIELVGDKFEVLKDMTLSALPFEDAERLAAQDDAAFDRVGPGPDLQDIAFWSAGMNLTALLPKGVAIKIPESFSLVLRVHYRGSGAVLTPRPRVGLHFAAEPGGHELKTLSIDQREIEIEPESYDFELGAERTLDSPVTIHFIQPRMQYYGREMTVTAHTPDGAARELLKVTNYLYKYQTRYVPTEPIALPAGTRIAIEALYENSYDNPNNPNMDPETATYGAAPLGEMLAVTLGVVE